MDHEKLARMQNAVRIGMFFLVCTDESLEVVGSYDMRVYKLMSLQGKQNLSLHASASRRIDRLSEPG